MGYFDAAMNRNFKKDGSGRTVYFPNSVFGRGRVLADADAEQKLRRFLKFCQMCVLLFVLSIRYWPWKHVWYFLAAYYAMFHSGVLYLLSGSPVSPERLTLREYAANTAREFGSFSLWFITIWGSLLVLMCAYILLASPEISNKLLGLLCGLLFGYFTLISSWALKIKSGHGY